MRFLLSVIAFCLVMITAKLYIPVAQAQECGTFDERTLMYIICEDGEQPEKIEELPTQEERIVELEKNMKNVINYLNEMTNINDIKQLKKDVKTLKNRKNNSGLTAKQVLELVDDNCRANSNGYNKMHPHSIACKT